MDIPSLQKTWQFDVNQATGGTGNAETDNADVWVKIKDAIIGLASGDWTVAASSDGTGGNADLNDNWGSYSDIDWNTAGNAHSWVVLANSSTGAQICMDCECASTASEQAEIYMSPGGQYVLAGLSTLNRPAAADEVNVNPGAVGWGGDSAAYNGFVHVMGSDDGECTRVVHCRVGFATGLWIFDEVRDPVTPWANPRVATATGQLSTEADYLTYANYNDVANLYGVAASSFDAFMTSEGYIASAVGQRIGTADSQSGGWPMCPMGICSETALNVGRKGSLYDIYWGSITRVTGDSYPDDGTYQFAQFGDIILPWNGTRPVVG
jgi:hypothetical protein